VKHNSATFTGKRIPARRQNNRSMTKGIWRGCGQGITKCCR